MDEYTRQLAGFVTRIDWEQLPKPVKDHAYLCVIDTLGCGVFGSTRPWSQILYDTVAGIGSLGSDGSASVWGTARQSRGPIDQVVLVNGAFVHAYEIDDLHAKAIVHPGGVTIPVALALAEKDNIDAATVMAGIVAGYEVTCRIGLGIGMGLIHRGWHNNSIVGPFAAAATAGRILGLNEEQMCHAFGIAASLASGLMAAQYGSMVKRYHAGHACRNGLYAALLAKNGYTGVDDVFTDTYGSFVRTVVDEQDLPAITEGLGEQWEMTNVGFKLFSACGSSHTSIDAILRLREEGWVTSSNVESIVVYASKATRDHVGWPYEPDSATTAQMNLSYSVAVALTDGAAFLDQYDDNHITNPEIVALTRKVRVEMDPDIEARGPGFRHMVRVVVTRTDGEMREVVVEHSPGSSKRPATREQVEDKVRGLIAHLEGPAPDVLGFAHRLVYDGVVVPQV